ncbi:hypothetical protein JW968_00015 [Candidatus Woesearchaeota archaeon]|nr:hypothetical protein [Candidatus Woesearchaeota archaeon]
MRFCKDEEFWMRKFMHNINSSYNVSKRSKVVLENRIIQKPVETTMESTHYPEKK